MTEDLGRLDNLIIKDSYDLPDLSQHKIVFKEDAPLSTVIKVLNEIGFTIAGYRTDLIESLRNTEGIVFLDEKET